MGKVLGERDTGLKHSLRTARAGKGFMESAGASQGGSWCKASQVSEREAILQFGSKADMRLREEAAELKAWLPTFSSHPSKVASAFI